MAPEVFRQDSGCTAGELRLVIRSGLSGYNSTDHTLDGDRARSVLAGIRQAHREAAKRSGRG